MSSKEISMLKQQFCLWMGNVKITFWYKDTAQYFFSENTLSNKDNFSMIFSEQQTGFLKNYSIIANKYSPYSPNNLDPRCQRFLGTWWETLPSRSMVDTFNAKANQQQIIYAICTIIPMGFSLQTRLIQYMRCTLTLTYSITVPMRAISLS
jgi:hypothetical protein